MKILYTEKLAHCKQTAEAHIEGLVDILQAIHMNLSLALVSTEIVYKDDFIADPGI